MDRLDQPPHPALAEGELLGRTRSLPLRQVPLAVTTDCGVPGGRRRPPRASPRRRGSPVRRQTCDKATSPGNVTKPLCCLLGALHRPAVGCFNGPRTTRSYALLLSTTALEPVHAEDPRQSSRGRTVRRASSFIGSEIEGNEQLPPARARRGPAIGNPQVDAHRQSAPARIRVSSQIRTDTAGRDQEGDETSPPCLSPVDLRREEQRVRVALTAKKGIAESVLWDRRHSTTSDPRA